MENVHLSPWHFVLARAYNWHRVDDSLFRSAQMYGGHIQPLLKHHGVATVINLRGANPNSTWYHPERAACEALGITHLDRPLHSRRLPKQEMLVGLLETFQSAARPMLIKCSGGADRTALAAALFLLHSRGATGLLQARRQMALLPYLHLPKRYQRWIRRFPDFYEAVHDGRDIKEWAQECYHPDRFAAWLVAGGFDGTWRKNDLSRDVPLETP